MKRVTWDFKLALLLVFLSLALNLLHYSLFHDLHDIFFWSLLNIAFLPISVLFVTLFIERLMVARETRNRREKLNMLAGTFFSAAGRQLLRWFSAWDPHPVNTGGDVQRSDDWSKEVYVAVKTRLKAHDFQVELGKMDLDALRTFLESQRDFLLRLLENPHLHEHETLTDTLRAVFHLADELMARPGFRDLPENDVKHLAGDIRRAYALLALQWLDYMDYLHRNYPYLFSLAFRTNPFDPSASAVVR